MLITEHEYRRKVKKKMRKEMPYEFVRHRAKSIVLLVPLTSIKVVTMVPSASSGA
jgi:hypothetical protein